MGEAWHVCCAPWALQSGRFLRTSCAITADLLPLPSQSFEAMALQKGAPRGVSRLMKPLKAFGYTVRQ